jgi:hypothetical protein
VRRLRGAWSSEPSSSSRPPSARSSRSTRRLRPRRRRIDRPTEVHYSLGQRLLILLGVGLVGLGVWLAVATLLAVL